MMQFFKLLCALLFAALMAACGGGGGNAGATSQGSGTGGVTASPKLTLELVDSSGANVTTVGSSTPVFARATARDAAGAALAGQVVTISGDAALVRFLPATGTALTGTNGIALVQVLPATANSAGAGTLTADATLAGAAVTQQISFQIPQGVSDAASARVANFVMLLDKSTLVNGGTSTAKLTVVAVDADNNVVSGAAVNVSTDKNTVFTPGSAATDASGQYTGQIAIGADRSDRQVTATVTVNGIVKQTTVQIAGSQLELTPTPNLLSPGGASTLTARVTDSAASPIAGAAVTFTSDIASLNGRTGVTSANGTVVVSFTAPVVNGSYLVGASASGISKQLSVQVGASNAIPDAVIPINTNPGLSANPNVVSPNAAGSTTNQSQLRFLFLDSNNQPIPNVRVHFLIASTGQGSFDSAVSTGSATVFTNSSGIATAAFIPGPTESPTDGVRVQACYQATDFTSSTQCDNSVEVHLTVTSLALAVSIGNDNKTDVGSGTYINQFVVTVADAAGRAVPNALVDISLDITHYNKGEFTTTPSFPADPTKYGPTDDPTVVPAAESQVSCKNEDLNRNGFVDNGENINNSVDSFGQPTLEPRRSDIILSYVNPAVRTTDASGLLLIKVEYSKRFAAWLSYRIRATTIVAGSQGSAERSFVTRFLTGDEVDPGAAFLEAPYGTGACDDPN
jgi:hypothetical protein